MTDTYRALCAELIDAVLSDDSHIDCVEIARRARAALAAQPEPPVDGEVAELVGFLRIYGDYAMDKYGFAEQLARAADLLERLAPQPVPEGPSDEELMELWVSNDWFNEGATLREFRSICRAVLARWITPNLEQIRSSLGDGPAVPEGTEPAAVVEEPSDEEIESWANASDDLPDVFLDPDSGRWERCFSSDEFCATVRAALARWGHP